MTNDTCTGLGASHRGPSTTGNGNTRKGQHMMNGYGYGMGYGGIWMILVVVLVVLGIFVALKYLRK